MKIEVNITKKYFFVLAGLLVITTLSFFAYAFNSGLAPNIVGHDSKEIEWVSPLVTPSFIQTTGPAATSYLQTTGNIYSSEQVIGAKGLCIGADCKSSWAQVGKGTLSCYRNFAQGAVSCPAGYQMASAACTYGPTGSYDTPTINGLTITCQNSNWRAEIFCCAII